MKQESDPCTRCRRSVNVIWGKRESELLHALDVMEKALKRNHAWQAENSRVGSYPESELEKINITALSMGREVLKP